jgi:hypothetical protein
MLTGVNGTRNGKSYFPETYEMVPRQNGDQSQQCKPLLRLLDYLLGSSERMFAERSNLNSLLFLVHIPSFTVWKSKYYYQKLLVPYVVSSLLGMLKQALPCKYYSECDRLNVRWYEVCSRTAEVREVTGPY